MLYQVSCLEKFNILDDKQDIANLRDTNKTHRYSYSMNWNI